MLTNNYLLLKANSFDSKTLNLFFFFLLNLFKKYYLQISIISLKKKKKKITLLKSPHVHKKAREQFQLIKFSFLIIFKVPQAKLIEFFSLIKLNMPKTIDAGFKLKSSKNLYAVKYASDALHDTLTDYEYKYNYKYH